MSNEYDYIQRQINGLRRNRIRPSDIVAGIDPIFGIIYYKGKYSARESYSILVNKCAEKNELMTDEDIMKLEMTGNPYKGDEVKEELFESGFYDEITNIRSLVEKYRAKIHGESGKIHAGVIKGGNR